jgi:hypothetical protein
MTVCKLRSSKWSAKYSITAGFRVEQGSEAKSFLHAAD